MSIPMKLDSPYVEEIDDRDFSGYQRLVYREAGIFLGPTKKALLVGRLARRRRELGGISFRDYLRLTEADAAERAKLLEAVCTHETHFFRVPEQFKLLEQEILPRWKQLGAPGQGGRKSIRVWSAGCSTGEEPFTLAMVLHHAFAAEAGWQIEIVATDLSARVLEQARAANWPIERASEIPTHYLKAYMLRGVGSQEGRMKAGPELRPMVRFERVNLNDDDTSRLGRFDLVFCRNVLIYFDTQSRARALERLFRHLAPHGYLFLGHAESLGHIREKVRAVIPAVFTQVSREP